MIDKLADVSDLELMVTRERALVDTFGYGSYRDENKEQQARNNEWLKALSVEAKRRELLDANGFVTAKGQATGFETNPRVVAKRADNQSYFHARFGGGASHISPYGERYGR